MKIWLTRDTAGSLMAGGLERVQVWFREPIYIETWRGIHEDEMPFSDPYSDLNGRMDAGWRVDSHRWINDSYSFGKLFGYADRMEENENAFAKEVWSLLCDHFGTENLQEWEDSPERDPRKWKVEIDLTIKAKLSI